MKARRIAALVNAPGWADLAELVAEQQAKWEKRFLLDVLDGKEINQREVDEVRGEINFARKFLKQPDRAASFLARANQEEVDE